MLPELLFVEYSFDLVHNQDRKAKSYKPSQVFFWITLAGLRFLYFSQSEILKPKAHLPSTKNAQKK